MELYPHKSGLGYMEPIAQIGHNVAVYYTKWRYYRVEYLEPIPPFQCLNIGGVAAADVSTKTGATNLELDTDEFGQFRWFPIDNAQVRIYIPEADGRFYLKNLMVPVDMNILDRDPCLHLTEIFIFQDKKPFFEAINLMDVALIQCRIIAMGYRFKGELLDAATIKAIQNGSVPCVHIVAQGRA